MKIISYVVIAYALLLLCGGVIAFAKAHSTVSLFMGSISALLLIACAVAMLKGISVGLTAALAVIIFLTALFGYRFACTFQLWPPGILALLSLILVLLLLVVQKWDR